MGIINACSDRNKSPSEGLNKREVAVLQNLYGQLSNGSIDISEHNLQEFFRENPRFGSKLFQFCKRLSNQQSISFDIFYTAVSLLIDNQNNRSEFRDNLEVLAVVSTQQLDLLKRPISYLEASELIKDLLCFALSFSSSFEGLETASSSFLGFLYEDKQNVISWDEFLKYVRNQLKYVCHFIYYYFSFKFLAQTVHFQPPRIIPRSTIFFENEQNASLHLLCLLMFGNLTAAAANEFNVVYTANRTTFKFSEFASSLLNFDGATFIVIKTENRDGTTNIFGGYKSTQWKVDPANYQGDEDSYVFSIYPRFCNFYPANSETSLPFYSFLNISQDGKRNGVGFGGNLNKSTFRIWLDRDTFNKSYTISEDITFDNGYLVDPAHETLNIQWIEILGIERAKLGGTSSHDSVVLLHQHLSQELDMAINNFFVHNMGNQPQNSPGFEERTERTKQHHNPQTQTPETENRDFKLVESELLSNDKKIENMERTLNDISRKIQKPKPTNFGSTYKERKGLETSEEIFSRGDQMRFSSLSMQLLGKTKKTIRDDQDNKKIKKYQDFKNNNISLSRVVVGKNNEGDVYNERLTHTIEENMRKTYNLPGDLKRAQEESRLRNTMGAPTQGSNAQLDMRMVKENNINNFPQARNQSDMRMGMTRENNMNNFPQGMDMKFGTTKENNMNNLLQQGRDPLDMRMAVSIQPNANVNVNTSLEREEGVKRSMRGYDSGLPKRSNMSRPQSQDFVPNFGGRATEGVVMQKNFEGPHLVGRSDFSQRVDLSGIGISQQRQHGQEKVKRSMNPQPQENQNANNNPFFFNNNNVDMNMNVNMRNHENLDNRSNSNIDKRNNNMNLTGSYVRGNKNEDYLRKTYNYYGDYREKSTDRAQGKVKFFDDNDMEGNAKVQMLKNSPGFSPSNNQFRDNNQQQNITKSSIGFGRKKF